jgi:alkylation response protein AidB-like acyl-CoA dehydrogenase
MPTTFRFALRDLPAEAEALRKEVREFLRETLDGPTPMRREKTWGGFNRDFSKKVGERGWIGMTWPKKYGGHERTFLERYVVLEEMLAAGRCSCASAPRRSARRSCPASRAARSPSPSA